MSLEAAAARPADEVVAKLEAWLATPLGKIEFRILLLVSSIGASEMFHERRRLHHEEMNKRPRNQRPYDASYWFNKSLGYLPEGLCRELKKLEPRWLKRIKRAKGKSTAAQEIFAQALETEVNQLLTKYGRLRG